MSGGVSHVDSFDPKPKLFADARQDGRRSTSSRPQRGLQDVPQAAAVGVRAARQVRHGGQRPVPAPGRVRRRPLRDPLDEDGPHRPLPGDARHPHRLVHVRAAEHRLVGQLRPGHDEPEPAVVRRPRAAIALRRRPGLGERLPARLPSGHARRPRRRADRQPPAPRRHAAACRSWNSACWRR